ncbi:MAG: ABC transporter substrate-binding protein [Candidatus Omnitrophica bacterium]|nr:ABC transporter substrate-binding protein [Candidatus Omnitrophota bacterium]
MKKALICLLAFIFICPPVLAKDLRVISLAPNLTEILFAIGLTEKEIVGLTNHCDYPEGVNKISKVGSLNTLSIEQIVSLKPDYVFSVGSERSPLNARLKKVGLNVIAFSPETIEGVLSCILKIGKIVNREKEARQVVDQMMSRLAKVKAKVRGIKDKQTVYLEIWSDPITSCGKGSLVDDVITYAGGINIANSVDTLYPALSQEFIVNKNPDAIILGYMSGDPANTISVVMNRFGWHGVNAVKKKRIICDINPALFLRPGPRVIEGIEQIHNRLYGNK